MKKINIIQLLQKIQSGTQPKTIKVFDKYYDWNGEDYFSDVYGEYMIDTNVDRYFLKDLVNEFFIEIPEPVYLTKAEKKWMEAIIEMRGWSRNVAIRKLTFDYPLMGSSDSISIVFKDTENIGYTFDKSCFTGMEFDHDYTADDLGLFNEEDE